LQSENPALLYLLVTKETKMKTSVELRAWLVANKSEITHFRPRRWCGCDKLLPYNRNKVIPLVNGPWIPDTPENVNMIREVLGNGMIEDPLT